MEAAAGLAGALFGRRGSTEVWQDREVRFDLSQAQLAPRRGEAVLETLDAVEDTKGNNGDSGRLQLTSLRVLWASQRAPRTNISIGLNTIASFVLRPASSRLKGSCFSLYVLTRSGSQRFEFIFTQLGDAQPALPAVLAAVLSAYEASRPCRELRIRGAVLVDKELRLLPREAAISRFNGVWNLAADAGSLGVLYITSMRVVWHSSAAAAFNVSVPLLQVTATRVAESKFGPALVLETSASAGGYVLGFRVDPRETLEYMHKELSSLLQAFHSCPCFGVEYTGAAMTGKEQQQDAAAAPPAESSDDAAELLDDSAGSDAWAAVAYAEDGGGGGSRGGMEPLYSAELGLAIEPPAEGVSVAQLWRLL